MKKVLGIVLIAASVIPPYVLYARMKDGNLPNAQLFHQMAIAAVTVFAVLVSCRFTLKRPETQVIGGIALSYVALMMLVVIGGYV